ncbi:DUF11 domain-containing protein [Adlercreutzia muris]|uniref:DUF11 domain-containing protein n=1 Tax=Adlercreutzia muris TaxID=1796610 RepID=A0A7C8FX77_9ACTN|nr:DUF11 domain-containing protein [Adlercreutzia muris]KAB1650941.1 DUF11 domain-containing protein [Adlercreutzia muris]MCR2028859.1 DUF11 domain-containing protein [Adlercreutzia muris]
MKANPKGRLLRGALAAVLAWGLMMPTAALAAGSENSETPHDAVTEFSEAPREAIVPDGSPDDPSAAADGSPSPALATPASALPAADAAPTADSTDRHQFGITVTGGTPGVDFEFEEVDYVRHAFEGSGTRSDKLHKLVIKGTAELTLTTDGFPTATQNVTIWVNPGVQANITLDNVNIDSPIPVHIERNRNDDGTTAEPKTRLHITLAENSDNTITATDGQRGAGIHCGEGTELVIDDHIPNVTTAGEPIKMEPANYPGKIPAGTTFIGNDGVTRTAGTEDGDDRLSLLENANRNPDGSLTTGKLTVTGNTLEAAIGSVQYEDAGDMTFNGGIITTHARGAGNGSAYTASIGGGSCGSGGTMTFNGGVIESWTSYHGASIGGGGWAVCAKSGAYHFEDTLPNKLVYTSQGSPDTVAPESKTWAGDIYINGGVLKPHSDKHGNAIGQGCCSWNEGHEIVIAGGTVLPDTSRAEADKTNPKPLTSCVSMAIGAQGGAVSVIGGSVRIGDVNGSKELFQAFINGDHSYDSAFGVWPVDTNRTDNPAVSMIAIDLSAEVIKKDEAGKPITDGNNAIIDWELTVAGEPYEYGAPAQFTDGKLYLWLPPAATEKQVSVTLSYLDENGKVQKVNPLFRNPGEGDILKRYVDFELPAQYTDKLTKYYDGTPFAAYDLDDKDNWITTDEELPKVLNMKSAVSYKYQRFTKRPAFEGDESSQAIGPEVSTGNDMPSDVGTMKFTMISTQYSNSDDPALAGFRESYWGHRAIGWCDIMPIGSKVSLINAEWVDDKAPGTEHHNSDLELALHATIDRADTQPDGKPTQPTCKAPEGYVQLYMDGNKVGDPIEIVFPEAAAPTTRAALTSAVATLAAGDGADSGDADGDKPAPNARRVDNGKGGSYTDFTYTFKPSDADFLVPDATTDGKHVVSVQYLPPDHEDVADLGSTAPANYLESVNPADNPEDAPKAEVAIDPIDPNPTVDLPADPDADPDKSQPSLDTDYDNPEADKPGADPAKPGDKTYHGNLNLIYEKPTPGADENPGAVDIKIKTPSSGAITVTTADGTIVEAEVVTDENGNPVRDDDGNITVRVNPEGVGKTELVIKQEPNGAYTGTTFEYDVTVKADPSIAPAPAVTKVAENLTHPNGPTQPGDRIRYTVTASNSAAGSAWNNVVVTDDLPACLDLVEDTVFLKNAADGFNKKLSAATGTPKLGEYGLGTAGVDGKRTLTAPAGTVWGAASAVLTFECTVKQGITGRDEAAAPLANTAEAEGTRDHPTDPKGDQQPVDPVESKPAVPEGGDTVAPADPAEGALALSKAVENTTSPDAKVTRLGDVLRYTITVKNTGDAGSCLVNAVISDPLPTGLEPVPNSWRLTLPGADKPVELTDDLYDSASRTVAVFAGNLWGGEEATLTFECTVTDEALGADIANVAALTGTVPSQTPDVDVSDETPGAPAPAPKPDDPAQAENPPVEPPVVIPNDPADGDVRVAKTAENATSADGKTRVGDTVRYRIVLANDGPGTGWMDAVIRDDVPRGLEPVSESIQMTLADGTVVPVSDEAYDEKTRRLSVSAGRLYGGQEIALAFDALVTEEAVGADIGNVAQALGTLPSQWDPDADGGFPAAGEPFDPPADWEAFDRASERVESAAVYPPGTNEKGGVIPAEGGPGEGTTIRAKRLAQTGDELAAGFALGAGAALAAGTALLLARRRLRRAR